MYSYNIYILFIFTYFFVFIFIVVFAGNLTWSVTNEDLINLITPVVPLLSIDVQRHADSKRSKGWGLIRFYNEDDANKCVSIFNGQEFRGRNFHFRYDKDKFLMKSEDVPLVYIGNLSWDATDSTLEEVFKGYNLMKAAVMTNMTGKSRGYGLLKFESVQDANKAIKLMDNTKIMDRTVEVRYDLGIDYTNNKMIHVAKLPLNITEVDIESKFNTCGNIKSIQLIKRRAIIEYLTHESAQNAIKIYDGKEFNDSIINVKRYRISSKKI